MEVAGQGLDNVRATTQDETAKKHKYTRKMASDDHLINECLSYQQLSEERKEKERVLWREKPLHGMYH